MKSYYTCLTFLVLLLISCKSTKNQVTSDQIKTLDNLVENKRYSIESNWAYPQVTYAMQQVLNSGVLQPGSAANSINLIGNANYLTIAGDSINAYLPYFGERQINLDYGGRDNAIELNGKIENYTITKSKNNRYLIKFNAKNKIETYSIIISLFPNLNSEIRINSSSRFPISYTGKVERISTD